MFKNYLTEEDYEVLDIEGTIPADLEGTFYRNGPGESHAAADWGGNAGLGIWQCRWLGQGFEGCD